MTTHTKDVLAQILLAAELPDLADKAAAGYYHDFLSPFDFPEMMLECDLRAAGTPAAEAIRQRHLNGEFDASIEESDAWVMSEEGGDALRSLLAPRKVL